jgi:hypothetical protein
MDAANIGTHGQDRLSDLSSLSHDILRVLSLFTHQVNVELLEDCCKRVLAPSIPPDDFNRALANLVTNNWVQEPVSGCFVLTRDLDGQPIKKADPTSTQRAAFARYWLEELQRTVDSTTSYDAAEEIGIPSRSPQDDTLLQHYLAGFNQTLDQFQEMQREAQGYMHLLVANGSAPGLLLTWQRWDVAAGCARDVMKKACHNGAPELFDETTQALGKVQVGFLLEQAGRTSELFGVACSEIDRVADQLVEAFSTTVEYATDDLELSTEGLHALRTLIGKTFNKNEFADVLSKVFSELNDPQEQLDSTAIEQFVRGAIVYAVRRSRVRELMNELEVQRPEKKADWQAIRQRQQKRTNHRTSRVKSEQTTQSMHKHGLVASIKVIVMRLISR